MKKILSRDGGGIRGVFTLQILCIDLQRNVIVTA